MSRLLLLLVAACGAPTNDLMQLDAAPQLPTAPATCGGAAGVTAQGALYNAEYVPFTFDGATVTANTNIIISTASASLTLETDTTVGDHMNVATQIRLGGEVRTTNLAHVIIDVNDGTCIAGRFEVALSGRVAGSFHTQ